jgi:uncharacterized membrane protein YvbJ
MFCPSCGKQNKDDVVFCAFCGKAIPQKKSSPPEIQPQVASTSTLGSVQVPRQRLSFRAKKAIITGIMVAALIIVILLIYYPKVFPWNW